MYNGVNNASSSESQSPSQSLASPANQKSINNNEIGNVVKIGSNGFNDNEFDDRLGEYEEGTSDEEKNFINENEDYESSDDKYTEPKLVVNDIESNLNKSQNAFCKANKEHETKNSDSKGPQNISSSSIKTVLTEFPILSSIEGGTLNVSMNNQSPQHKLFNAIVSQIQMGNNQNGQLTVNNSSIMQVLNIF